jgi:hypothetical protein
VALLKYSSCSNVQPREKVTPPTKPSQPRSCAAKVARLSRPGRLANRLAARRGGAHLGEGCPIRLICVASMQPFCMSNLQPFHFFAAPLTPHAALCSQSKRAAPHPAPCGGLHQHAMPELTRVCRHLMRQVIPAPRHPFLLALIQEGNGMMGRWEIVARQSDGETGWPLAPRLGPHQGTSHSPHHHPCQGNPSWFPIMAASVTAGCAFRIRAQGTEEVKGERSV